LRKPPAKSVFINCPFDDRYQPLFRALCLAVLACGRIARCALELSDAGYTRIERLRRLIAGCDLGIHDISRTECSPLPRFNMPFELGFFLGAKGFGPPLQRKKKTLIMDRRRYRYQRFLSDISGQDIQAHSDGPENVVRIVRRWLVANTAPPHPSEAFVLRSYRNYRRWRPRILAELGSQRPDFSDELRVMTYSLKETLKRSRPRAPRRRDRDGRPSR